MRTKLSIAVMVLVLVFYAALIGVKGLALLGSGSVVGVLRSEEHTSELQSR